MADTSKILDGESGGSPQTQPTLHGQRDRRKTGAPRTGTARAVLYALVATGLLVLSPIGAGLAAASPPSLSPTVNNTTAVGGTPFTYTVSFTVTGAPEADPITVTDTPDSANPGLTILSVPLQADPNWDCSGTNISAQMVSCTYTPAGPTGTPWSSACWLESPSDSPCRDRSPCVLLRRSRDHRQSVHRGVWTYLTRRVSQCPSLTRSDHRTFDLTFRVLPDRERALTGRWPSWGPVHSRHTNSEGFPDTLAWITLYR